MERIDEYDVKMLVVNSFFSGLIIGFLVTFLLFGLGFLVPW